MRFCKTYDFDHGIKALQLGWSLAGPPMMTVYCYLFGETMVDTGQSHMKKEALALAGSHGVKQIFLTHHHEDHSGNAAAIHSAQGATVYGHALTQTKLRTPYDILPYQKYVWGKTTPVSVNALAAKIDTSLGCMMPVHTPGHSKDHTVYFLPEQGIIFSGDLYLGDRIKFFRSDEDVGTQIASLKKVAAMDFDTVLCAHNPCLKNGKKHILTKLDFLENLYGDIVFLWEKGISERQIFKKLKLREARFIKYVCCGNVSMLNGVRSVIHNIG
ncbi:Glyoxylase, beta-lactamase superfamily II [Desulfocicer vacuolatum DSM 3385]|uniref:Glyoxylase, beta-lactamase superfamily II n=1 Tax=Desulfocicer vacuolatum DSM 3385 TaxID=1121400 RepID=A0A1W2EKL6_9BACT|nr:MBL fold metallo-hydrolase [Desulfocicer vacuolatum]SMD10223.1 Glyoxylase, beta-lactamase superfamily II [Desulfocicer vacuolatum DSM 3385]